MKLWHIIAKNTSKSETLWLRSVPANVLSITTAPPYHTSEPSLNYSLLGRVKDSPIWGSVEFRCYQSHYITKKKAQQHTDSRCKDRKSAAERRHEPVLALRSVPWSKDHSSTFDVLSSHGALSLCWTSIWGKALLIFNCDSIRSIYFPRVSFVGFLWVFLLLFLLFS